MSAAGSSEEQFLCSICLEVLSEPVSTPCGHNFCKRCISQMWDTNVHCFCPLCKEVFSTRPQLRTNTLLSDIVFQSRLEKRSNSIGNMPTFQEVLCDSSVSENQRLVEQRRLKIQQIRAALELSETEAQRETEQMVKVFSDIRKMFQRILDHHTKVIEETQNKQKKHAQALIHQLQQEMCELEKSSTEAQQLSLSTDPLHFLQRCTALPPAGLKDWSSVSFEPQTSEGSAARALSELEESLSQKFNKIFRPESLDLWRVQQFAVDITLDPDTAAPWLVLSEDLKQVHDTDVKKKLPDSPQRFNRCPSVLGKQSFSSGRFYFEVQVKGKTDWTLGVAQESINRKGQIKTNPKNGFWTIVLRSRDGYSACTDPWTALSPQRPPQKVGVFVDYGAGLVSFYDVDSADFLYSFTGCRFRDRLFPYLCPCPNDKGRNLSPLIISAVKTNSGGD